MSYNRTYGYTVPQDGTGLLDEIIASDQYQMVSITIATAARDAGNPAGTTNLRRGLVMQYESSTKKYVEVDDANLSPTCVVLAENIPNIDAGDVVAKAFYKATFKAGKLIDASTLFDITKCQRLSVRDNA